MEGTDQILAKLPEKLAKEIKGLPQNILSRMEEIRIRVGKPVLIYSGGKEYALSEKNLGVMDKEKVTVILNRILDHSPYAFQEELSQGYVTIEGGHRTGVCGRIVLDGGSVKTIKDISSLNIRRSREIVGISDPYLKYMINRKDEIYNTVIVSPPKCGKTTLLRDMIRNFSSRGFKVGVCDERSELAGTYNGQPSYDMGPRTDILDGCPKALGMVMLIRSMAPEIIATDEIGKKEDCSAIEAAVCAGIGLITTIHGNHFDDLLASGIGPMVENGVFQRFLFMSNRPTTGTVEDIRDEKNRSVL